MNLGNYFLAVVLLFTSAAFGQLKGTSFAQAKAAGAGEMEVVFVNTPGFSSVENGKPTGICFRIMDEFKAYVTRKHGINLSYQVNSSLQNDFPSFLKQVKAAAPGVIGLGNITVTPERREVYAFTKPFIDNIAIIITQKGVSELGSLSKISSNFSGFNAITVRGTTNEKRLLEIRKNHFPGMKIKYVGSSPMVLDGILNDPTSFTSLDFTYYLNGIKNDLPIKRHPAGDESSEHFAFISPQENDWIPVLNEFMDGFVGSAEYRQIIADELGVNALKLLDAVTR